MKGSSILVVFCSMNGLAFFSLLSTQISTEKEELRQQLEEERRSVESKASEEVGSNDDVERKSQKTDDSDEEKEEFRGQIQVLRLFP